MIRFAFAFLIFAPGVALAAPSDAQVRELALALEKNHTAFSNDMAFPASAIDLSSGFQVASTDAAIADNNQAVQTAAVLPESVDVPVLVTDGLLPCQCIGIIPVRFEELPLDPNP